MRRSLLFRFVPAIAFLIFGIVPTQAFAQARLIADLELFPFSGSPPSHAGGHSWVVGNALYFNSVDDQNNRSLWRYDGTSTQKVRDGLLNGIWTEQIGDMLVFSEVNQNGTRELYCLEQGVVEKLEPEEGAEFFDFHNGVRFRDSVLLPGAVNTGSYYNEGVIWVTDGHGLTRVFTSPYLHGEMPYKMAATSDGVYLFFHHFNYDDGTTYYTGEDVWYLEGGQGPGTLVHQFEAINGQQPSIQNTVAVNDVLYVAAKRQSPSKTELWRITPSGIDEIPISDGTSLSPKTMTSVGNRVYFNAATHIWSAQGTTATQVDARYNFSSQGDPYMVHGDNVYFILRDDGAVSWQLFRQEAWGSDVILVDDHPFVALPSQKEDQVPRPEGIYFRATDTRYVDGWGNVEELWFTDGNSIRRVSDNASDQLYVAWLVGVLGDDLIFGAQDQSQSGTGYQLWAVNINSGSGGNAAVNHTLSSFDQNGDSFNWIIDNTAPVDSGYVFGPNLYGDQAKAIAFSLPDQASVGALNAVTFWWGHKRDGLSGGTYDVNVYNGSSQTGPQGAPLFSKAYNLADIVGDADEGTPPQPMTYQFDSPVTVGSDFFVAIDFGQYSADLIGGMTLAAGNFNGQSVPEVWELWGNGEWHTVSSAWLNDSNGWRLWAEAEVSISGSVANELDAVLPEGFALLPNYPNPFNPTTDIGYSLSSSGHVTLDVYDITGRLVSRLVDREAIPGQYTVRMNGDGLPSGLYFYRLRQNGLAETRSMVLLK